LEVSVDDAGNDDMESSDCDDVGNDDTECDNDDNLCFSSRAVEEEKMFDTLLNSSCDGKYSF